MFVTFYAIIFESQTLWIKKCWAACRKRILTWNSSQGHSRSCILQSVTGRQGVAYRHYIYNTAGLISEVSEEIATQIAKNCRHRQPHSHLMPPTSRTHANERMHLIFPETRVILAYILPLIQICAVGSKRRIFSATECVLAVQGHPRSMILLPIESAYATSYWSVIVNSLWLWSYLAPFLRYGDLLAIG